MIFKSWVISSHSNVDSISKLENDVLDDLWGFKIRFNFQKCEGKFFWSAGGLP